MSNSSTSPAYYVDILSDQDSKVDDLPPPYDSIPDQPPAVAARDSAVYSYSSLPHFTQRPPAYEPASSSADQSYSSPMVYSGPDLVNEPAQSTATDSSQYCSTVSSDNHLYRVVIPEQEENEYELNESYSYEYPDQCATIRPPTVPPRDGRRQQVEHSSQAADTTGSSESKPKSWLPWSIVTLVILCLPLGIPATVLSALSLSDYKKGNYAAAKKKATAAFVLNIIGTVCGGLIIFTLIGGVLFVVGILACCCKG